MSRDLPLMLGQAAALGFSPAQLLRADPVEQPLLARAMQHAADWQAQRDKTLARLIVNELAEALKRGR